MNTLDGIHTAVSSRNSVSAGEIEAGKTANGGQFEELAERIILDPSKTVMQKFEELRSVAGEDGFTDDKMMLMSNLFQQFSRLMTLFSNMLKIVHDTMMSPIRNIRA